MAKYAVAGKQATLTTTFKTCMIITAPASSPRRGKIYDLLLGSDTAGADNVIQFDISRQTAAGTTTSVTPVPLDSADAASAALAGSNATVEGTVTASTSVLNGFLNQRATQRWVAVPGSELVYPATASNGFAVRALSTAYTNAFGGTGLFEEQ